MVGIGVRFELGRYHATPWGTNVNEARVEWPPSPWRILRALYSVARTNTGLADDLPAVDRVLGALAGIAPVYELPAATAAHTRHYVPSREHSPSRPEETDRLLDGFLALDPDDELRAWWDIELPDRDLMALARAVGALGYLGRSESACTARMLDEEPPADPDALPLEVVTDSDEREAVELLCLEGTEPLDALASSVDTLRKHRRLVPPGTRLVEYGVRARRRIAVSTGEPVPRPTLARFRVHGGARPPIRDAVLLATHLRTALQSVYGAHAGGHASSVLSGHGDGRPRNDQHRHAHYLATPGRDGRRIEHLVAWAPEGFGQAEVAALGALRELRLRDAPEPLLVALVALGRTDELDLPSLLGPSRRWRSLTPFGLPRHPKRRGGRVVETPEEQIHRELAARDLPEPSAVRLVRGPWLEFRRTRPGVSRLEAPRAVGIEIEFGHPLRGPIALGKLSHFGLGLFAPAAQ